MWFSSPLLWTSPITTYHWLALSPKSVIRSSTFLSRRSRNGCFHLAGYTMHCLIESHWHFCWVLKDWIISFSMGCILLNLIEFYLFLDAEVYHTHESGNFWLIKLYLLLIFLVLLNGNVWWFFLFVLDFTEIYSLKTLMNSNVDCILLIQWRFRWVTLSFNGCSSN